MPAPNSPVSRRALLTATGVGALAAVAGCNPFTTAKRTVTVTAQQTPTTSAPPSTPIRGLVFTTRLHVQRLESAIRVDKRDSATLTMLLRDRQAHLAALQREYARSVGRTSVALPPAPTQTTTTPTMSDDPDEVIGVIRGDAATAQNMFTDALAGASAYRAQLYASIAACVATHRAVLA